MTTRPSFKPSTRVRDSSPGIRFAGWGVSGVAGGDFGVAGDGSGGRLVRREAAASGERTGAVNTGADAGLRICGCSARRGGGAGAKAGGSNRRGAGLAAREALAGAWCRTVEPVTLELAGGKGLSLSRNSII